jgi:K+-transporting ATPase KdpF subunit
VSRGDHGEKSADVGDALMDGIYLVSGLIVAALTAYLIYVLAHPERF